ncbi:GGDEF domain-containing response regulator [Pseudoalteromonas pernae]|uniref:GGDEF domain-containing response regulator n=1 Tax=Pseudoalteromonas pernae TaxID=3118054 RepID=UPI00324265BB
MPRRLLLVEDTPTIAKLQTLIAQRAGYEVDLAVSLAHAKNLCQEHTYYCAVVDYILPDAGNGEAIDYIISQQIPCIVMTAQLNDDVHSSINEKTIVEYITKENRQSYHYLEKRLASLPRNEKTTVLVVDDSRTTREYLANLLKRQLYQVEIAEDGLDALKKLELNSDIKIIVTDSEMPNMNGNELCAKVRERYTPEEKVIIGVSSTANSHLSSRFLKNGANDYLTKPFNEEEFYCRINQNMDLVEQFEKVRQQANHDDLTNLANRRHFFTSGQKFLKHCAKHKRSICVAMLDIDHFKDINDSYGHDGGDEALKYFAALFIKHFNEHFTARMGGEEFALLFKHGRYQEAYKSLMAFRDELRTRCVTSATNTFSISVSVGLIEAHSYDLDRLLTAADKAMYQAKSQGRDQIVMRQLDDD